MTICFVFVTIQLFLAYWLSKWIVLFMKLQFLKYRCYYYALKQIQLYYWLSIKYNLEYRCSFACERRASAHRF